MVEAEAKVRAIEVDRVFCLLQMDREVYGIIFTGRRTFIHCIIWFQYAHMVNGMEIVWSWCMMSETRERDKKLKRERESKR